MLTVVILPLTRRRGVQVVLLVFWGEEEMSATVQELEDVVSQGVAESGGERTTTSQVLSFHLRQPLHRPRSVFSLMLCLCRCRRRLSQLPR